VEHSSIAKQVMEMLHHLLVPRDVLQCFRTYNLIEFLSQLRQIVKIADFEIQAVRLRSKEAKILARLLHLPEVHRHAENAAPAPVSGVGQRPVAASRIQSVNWSLAEKSWKKAVSATCIEIKPRKEQPFSPQPHSIAHRQYTHGQRVLRSISESLSRFEL
jgi:hypothetical protein